MMLPPIQLADVERVRAAVPLVRNHWRRTKIQIPVETCGHRPARAKARRPKNPAAVPVNIDGLELADAATTHKFTSLPKLPAVFAALLRARLVNPAITANRGEHCLAFLNGYGGRFLAVNIFASRSRHRCHGGVPMGGRGDEHRINVGPGEDLAKIIVSLAGFIAALPINFGIMIVYAFGRPLAPIAPDIANREYLDLFSARVPAGHVSPGATKQ